MDFLLVYFGYRDVESWKGMPNSKGAPFEYERPGLESSLVKIFSLKLE